MLDPARFREIVSGRQRGPAAAALRGLLAVAEVPYRAAVRWRNRRYDRHRAEVHRVEVPVVSVGNLTLGGTGKTPMVEYLVGRLQAMGLKPAVVSRGYGARRDGINDEALELRRRLPGVPHVQNPDRVAAARQAIDRHGAEAIVLDDGFQHRRLARDLDLVMLDALEPLGFERVFPRGTLREPLDGLRRADMVVLSRADLLSPSGRAELWQRVNTLAPGAARGEAVHGPISLVDADGGESPLEHLVGQPVAAFCGIGNPAGFRQTLELCGCQLAGWRTFPDHHDYSLDDAEHLAGWAAALGAAWLICTEKDLVKLSPLASPGAASEADAEADGADRKITKGKNDVDAAAGPADADDSPDSPQNSPANGQPTTAETAPAPRSHDTLAGGVPLRAVRIALRLESGGRELQSRLDALADKR